MCDNNTKIQPKPNFDTDWQEHMVQEVFAAQGGAELLLGEGARCHQHRAI